VVLTWCFAVERVTGIEPALSAWELYGAAARLPADWLTCGSAALQTVRDRDCPRWLLRSGTQRARPDHPGLGGPRPSLALRRAPAGPPKAEAERWRRPAARAARRLDLVRHDSATESRARVLAFVNSSPTRHGLDPVTASSTAVSSDKSPAALALASSSRSQVAAWATSAAARVACGRPSVRVHWRPPSSVAIVTHLVTQSLVPLANCCGSPAVLASTTRPANCLADAP